MTRILYALIVAGMFLTTAFGADKEKDKAPAPAAAAAEFKVEGLEISAPQKVAYDEGFVLVTAKCTGDVRWIVIGTHPKLKYQENTTTKELIVSVPPTEATVMIFCVGVVNGKLTPAARTEVIVTPPDPRPSPTPGPTPEPTPTPTPASDQLHVTIVEDPQKRTPELGKLLVSTTLRKALADLNAIPRIYSVRDPALERKNFSPVLQQIGSVPALIIQNNGGKVLVAVPLPTAEADIIARVKILRGN